LNPKTFQKADPRVVNTIKIAAHTGVPVKLGTTINNSQKLLQHSLVAVTTISSMDFPCLFAQPCLVIPDHQGQVMFILHN
jgi:hypothetical protein